MDEYPKIEIEYAYIVNICFRIKERLFNEGRIVLDKDTCNFIGHLADDVIVGYYKNGVYTIHYFYTGYNFFEDGYECYVQRYSMQESFLISNIFEDFYDKEIEIGDMIIISFLGIEEDPSQIDNSLKRNLDLIIPKN